MQILFLTLDFALKGVCVFVCNVPTTVAKQNCPSCVSCDRTFLSVIETLLLLSTYEYIGEFFLLFMEFTRIESFVRVDDILTCKYTPFVDMHAWVPVANGVPGIPFHFSVFKNNLDVILDPIKFLKDMGPRARFKLSSFHFVWIIFNCPRFPFNRLQRGPIMCITVLAIIVRRIAKDLFFCQKQMCLRVKA